MDYLQKGGNALGHAAYKNHFAVIEYLLQHDADPNSKDNVDCMYFI